MKLKFTTTVALAAAAFTGAAFGQAAAPNSESGYPVDAQPGQCFARVIVPEVTEEASEEVVVQAARQEAIVIPAQYETVQEQVVVREARTEFQVVPATYKTVTETVVVEPERTEQIVAPASSETYSERVMVRPGYVTWKPGSGLFGRGIGPVGPATASNVVDQHTGELLCRVEVPAEYATVQRQRVVRAESTQTRVIPAKTREVTRQVIDQPARVVERAIPAETRMVAVQKLVSPARTDMRTIPAVTRTETRRRVVRPASVEWREVLCETNASTARISDIQRALAAKGFANPVDGRFGPQTLTAMERYQRANGLAVGYLTAETVRSLGVAFR